MTISICDNNFRMLPEKGIIWIEKNSLILADLHLGKSTVFRARGIAAPEGPDESDLDKLKRIINENNVSRIIILGDLVHARSHNIPSLTGMFLETVKGTEVILIEGNHDKVLRKEKRIELVTGEYEEDKFIFSHRHSEDQKNFVFAGHIHPSVILTGKGKTTERLPCFYFSAQYALLPSFGSFTGSYIINPGKNDRVFIPADGGVFEVTGRA